MAEKAGETSVKKAAAAAASIADSAVDLRDSATLQLESAERRTQLAASRNVLAAERTYTAWVRTGLAALAGGVGAKPLLADVVTPWLGSTTGTVLLLFAGWCFVAGVWRVFQLPGTNPVPDIQPLPRALMLTMNGLLLVVTLAALVGIWVVQL